MSLRPPSPDAPPPAPPTVGEGAGAASALTPEEHALLTAHMQLRRAQAEHQARRGAEVAAYRQRRAADEARRVRELEEAQERAALEARPPGPCLPPHKRHARAVHLQEEDLEELVPDGWGAMWPEECERWGARMGLPPLAVPLLRLLEWVQGLRASQGRGAAVGCGFQVSPEWLARKLGCSERWVQALTVRLDPWSTWRREVRRAKLANAWRERRNLPPLPLPAKPTGTAYLCRFPQLRLYKTLTRDLPPHQRRERWLCRDGRLRRWVDLRGVYYATHQGLRLLRRRAHRSDKPRRGHRPKLARSPMAEDLARRLAPLYRRLRARLAPRVERDFTPNNVKPSVTTYLPGPRRGPLRVSLGAGPPWGAGPPPPDGGGGIRRQRVPSRGLPAP